MKESGALRAFLTVNLLAGVATAHPPNDDFLNAQPPGRRLTLMPFVGPGFRSIYDQRIEIEKDMSEVRVQLMGTVTVPFAEASANVDVRLFLMTFGATAGYHDEWHLLQFRPDPTTGRDRGGQPPSPEPPSLGLAPGKTPLPPYADPATTFTDLDRDARAVKDAHADVQHAAWPFYEGRWGFVWPAYGFMGVSTLALRSEARPDVSYDWENATVTGHGLSYRWEGYFLLRARNSGFVGPALRALYLPRNRTRGDATVGPYHVVVEDGSACQMGGGLSCHRGYEPELHYGVLAGLCPGWGHGDDTLLVRAYATWGLHNDLFGTQAFRQPLQILVAYMASIEL